MKKGTLLYSVLKQKCPRCHEGDLFFEPNPYKLRKISDMPERCSVCNQKYSPEPGFYFGAAYVSYGFAVALGVSIYVAIRVLFEDVSVETYLFAIISGLLLFMPLNYRMSRALWINLFVKFDKGAVDKNNEKKQDDIQ